MVQCNDATDEFTLTLKPHKWGSNPYDRNHDGERGEALAAFLKKIGVKGKICDYGGCAPEGQCYIKSVKIEIPKGKGKFHTGKVDPDDKDDPNSISSLVIKDECEIKIVVACQCVSFAV